SRRGLRLQRDGRRRVGELLWDHGARRYRQRGRGLPVHPVARDRLGTRLSLSFASRPLAGWTRGHVVGYAPPVVRQGKVARPRRAERPRERAFGFAPLLWWPPRSARPG